MIRLNTHLHYRPWRLPFRVTGGADRLSFCWKVLSATAPQSSCQEGNITVKIFLFPKGDVLLSWLKVLQSFSLIAHLSQVVACHFGSCLLVLRTAMHWICSIVSCGKHLLNPLIFSIPVFLKHFYSQLDCVCFWLLSKALSNTLSQNEMDSQEFVMVTFVPFKPTERNQNFRICWNTKYKDSLNSHTLEREHCKQRATGTAAIHAHNKRTTQPMVDG